MKICCLNIYGIIVIFYANGIAILLRTIEQFDTIFIGARTSNFPQIKMNFREKFCLNIDLNNVTLFSGTEMYVIIFKLNMYVVIVIHYAMF